MISACCPHCNSPIEIQGNPEVGQQVKCQKCLTMLVITWLYPLCLDFLDEPLTNQPKTAQRPEV
jgi:hypothetical protein